MGIVWLTWSQQDAQQMLREDPWHGVSLDKPLPGNPSLRRPQGPLCCSCNSFLPHIHLAAALLPAPFPHHRGAFSAANLGLDGFVSCLSFFEFIYFQEQ